MTYSVGDLVCLERYDRPEGRVINVMANNYFAVYFPTRSTSVVHESELSSTTRASNYGFDKAALKEWILRGLLGYYLYQYGPTWPCQVLRELADEIERGER